MGRKNMAIKVGDTVEIKHALDYTVYLGTVEEIRNIGTVYGQPPTTYVVRIADGRRLYNSSVRKVS